ncbi:mitochondrial import receptor subunit TOM22 homolog [Liolophura sinensis]|uniref:mitochondrial import receptor subunit TOM22 homolog n=1 Tax=Liolophura sinensis TaxID=3198878 RepID=UPI003158D576
MAEQLSEGPGIELASGHFGPVPVATSLEQSPTKASGATTTTDIVRPQDLSVDDDDDDIDESLAERLWGLTEMFPEGLRKAVGNLTSFSIFGAKTLFSLGKSATWIAASSATILVLPVMFEGERAQLQEQQIQQQRQILLGPNAAVSGSAGAGGLLPGAMPGVMQVPVPQR